MPLEKDKAWLPLSRECSWRGNVSQWHLGLRGDRRARASAWEEEARKSRSLADGGMGSILSLSLGDSGMKQLNPRNALLLPQAKRVVIQCSRLSTNVGITGNRFLE